jgi:hypothetical protein
LSPSTFHDLLRPLLRLAIVPSPSAVTIHPLRPNASLPSSVEPAPAESSDHCDSVFRYDQLRLLRSPRPLHSDHSSPNFLFFPSSHSLPPFRNPLNLQQVRAAARNSPYTGAAVDVLLPSRSSGARLSVFRRRPRRRMEGNRACPPSGEGGEAQKFSEQHQQRIREEAAFGLPDDPLYPSSSSSDTASLADAVPPSMTASYAASSVVADSEEDEDDYDSFVECRLRICEETASSASPSFLQIPLVLSHKLTSLLCRLSRPPLPHLPSTGLSNLLGKRRRPHPDELEVRPSELDECLSGFPSSIGCWSTGFVHEDR